MKKWILFATLLLGVVSACKKEKLKEEEAEITPTPMADELVIADSSKMAVTILNKSLQTGYHQPQILELDLDHDLVPDIQFNNEIAGSLGMGNYQYIEISCLNPDVQLHYFTQNDSIFFNTEMEYYVPDSTRVSANTHHYKSCERRNSIDSIKISPNNFYLTVLQEKAVIKKADPFKNGTFNLMAPNPSSITETGTHGDTTFFSMFHQNLSCNDFPNGVISYIGFKMNTSQKMGWIKVKSDQTLYVYESAIQQ
ncbi:MAG TPA: hypothetical protein VFF27_15120 [Bacteroidia bacterium]|jgi:hypothetical protein|nr:hypothetical protein [Bacteroidia bacterium]